MAADGDQSPQVSNKRSPSLIRRLIANVDIRDFLNALKARWQNFRVAAPDAKVKISERYMTRASEYLEICQENALDAYTIEDALYWHNEIITELSIELNLIHSKKWPQTVKASMSRVLEDRLDQHVAAVTRLAGVLEKNEPLIWQP
jgi:hypothetical protein